MRARAGGTGIPDGRGIKVKLRKKCASWGFPLGALLAATAALGAALTLGAGGPGLSGEESKPRFSAEEFRADVKFLSSDRLKGRGNGTRELGMAADFIAQRFREFGLRPAGDDGTYFQHFLMTVGAKLGPQNSLAYGWGESRKKLALKKDFVPFGFSADGTFDAPLAFAGYGITASNLHYDDYEGLDAKGKIVIVLRHEPQEDDGQSLFSGKQLTTHSTFISKAINARNHGAGGMILVNDVGNHPDRKDQLVRFGRQVGPEEMRLAVVQVKVAVVDEWLKPSGRTLDELRQAIDKDLSNHSFVLKPSPHVVLTVDVKRNRKQVANVIGIVPGNGGDVSDQAIVVGAHYDHLGLGEQSSLAPNPEGKIHHGADDNASGTSGLLELARGLSRRGVELGRSIVFAAFAGEEAGLLGSTFYTNHPAVPLDRTIAMINLDMIGRVTKNRLYVGGTGTSPGLRSLVEEANRSVGFELRDFASGYGASDHMSFTVREVPVLFFFSGLHSDYHRPSDTWEKIDAEDGAKIVQLVANIVEELDRTAEKPQFVRVAEPAPHGAGGGGGYGPYFGSVPDFGEIENGVRFADVRDGSPAGKAGFKGGDTLIEFGDKRIENLYDFTYALRSHKPGDKVQVTVLRDGAKVTRKVTLEERK